MYYPCRRYGIFWLVKKPILRTYGTLKQFLDSLSTDIMCLRHSLILFRTVMVRRPTKARLVRGLKQNTKAIAFAMAPDICKIVIILLCNGHCNANTISCRKIFAVYIFQFQDMEAGLYRNTEARHKLHYLL